MYAAITVFYHRAGFLLPALSMALKGSFVMPKIAYLAGVKEQGSEGGDPVKSVAVGG